MPTGSRVTFAARVIRCGSDAGVRFCLIADESGFFRAEGQGVQEFRAAQSFRIENAVLRGKPVSLQVPEHPRRLVLDRETRVIPLQDPIAIVTR